MAGSERGTKVGIKEIARDAEVSISTVSHVINGTAPISAEVRRRVLAAARKLGYLDRQRARATIATLSSVLLAIPSDAAAESETNLVTWSVLNALRRECERRAIRIVPHVGETPRLGGAEIAERAKTENVDGLIVLTDDRPELLRVLRDAGPPVVLVNGEDPEMTVDSVVPENRFGARLGTEWLLRLGHRRILHLTWPGRTTIRRRRDGFTDAFIARGLRPPEELIMELESYEPIHAERAIDRMLDETGGVPDVTAIFCAADNLALGTLRALVRRGVRVPDDVSVLGFDDIMLGELSAPALSTIHVPLGRLGPEALRLLEQGLIDNDSERPAHRLGLGCRVVERGSVAKPGR